MTTQDDLPGGEPQDEPQSIQMPSVTDREQLRRERAMRARAEHAELERERSQTSVAPPGLVAEPAALEPAPEHRSFKLTAPMPVPEGSPEHRSFKLTPPMPAPEGSPEHRPFKLTR